MNADYIDVKGLVSLMSSTPGSYAFFASSSEGFPDSREESFDGDVPSRD